MPLGTVTIVKKYCTNKCHNIFTKHLFSIVVGYNLIFYYFISTCCSYSVVQKHWMYSDIYKREKKVQTEDLKKKKVSTVATWYYSYRSKLERKKKSG